MRVLKIDSSLVSQTLSSIQFESEGMYMTSKDTSFTSGNSEPLKLSNQNNTLPDFSKNSSFNPLNRTKFSYAKNSTLNSKNIILENSDLSKLIDQWNQKSDLEKTDRSILSKLKFGMSSHNMDLEKSNNLGNPKFLETNTFKLSNYINKPKIPCSGDSIQFYFRYTIMKSM